MIRSFSFAFFLSLFFIACGPSGGGCNNTTLDTLDNNNSDNNITYTVLAERGPVFLANVYDAKKQKAVNANLGFSNIYRFEKEPKYPITLEKGYIDLNRDNIININDMLLDINMSSYSLVISPLTTIVGNDLSRIKYLNNYLSISREEIQNKIPSESSINAVVLSNGCYKAIKLGYTFASEEFNETLEEVKTIYQENFLDIKDSKKLAQLLEEKIVIKSSENQVNLLDIKNPTGLNTNTNTNTNTLLNNNFSYTYNTTDSIEEIWSIPIEIKANQTVKNVAIGINFIKEGSTSNGIMIIKGIDITNNRITDVESVVILGEKSTGSKGSVLYDATHHITKNSVVIIQGKYILINMGYVINHQDVVSKSSFKNVSRTNITIYLSNIDIGGEEVGKVSLRSDADEGVYQFPQNTQRITGIIEVKGK